MCGSALAPVNQPTTSTRKSPPVRLYTRMEAPASLIGTIAWPGRYWPAPSTFTVLVAGRSVPLGYTVQKPTGTLIAVRLTTTAAASTGTPAPDTSMSRHESAASGLWVSRLS